MTNFNTKSENKPENPFQNYDVTKKTLKTNQNFAHFKEKTTKFCNRTDRLGGGVGCARVM